MTNPPLRWGILSTANIARKNWQAIQFSGNATVTAVASQPPLPLRFSASGSRLIR